MTDKLHSDTQSNIESIVFQPNLQDTGDMEAGTRTITATSEPVGLVNADYSHSLTLPKLGDARLVVKRIVNRLETTIASMTAGHFYYRVYVDAQDAGTGCLTRTGQAQEQSWMPLTTTPATFLICLPMVYHTPFTFSSGWAVVIGGTGLKVSINRRIDQFLSGASR